jgi:predicted transposase YbfD/YdcC
MSFDDTKLLDIPETGVKVIRKGPKSGVYKVLKGEKKGKATTELVLIGKVDGKTGKVIPNEKYFEYYRDPDKYVDHGFTIEFNMKIGVELVFDRVMDYLGINEILDEWNVPTQLIQTAVLYMILHGNIFDEIDEFSRHCLFKKPLTAKSATALFDSFNDKDVTFFFKKWIEKQKPKKVFAYDSIAYESALEMKFPNDNLRDEYRFFPHLHLGYFYSQDSELPLMYVTYDDFIQNKRDVAKILGLSRKLGIKDVCLYLYREFCTESNLKFLESKGIDFIVSPPGDTDMASDLIDNVEKDIVCPQNKISTGKYAVRQKGVFYGIDSYVFVYFDEGHAIVVKEMIDSNIDALILEYNKNKYFSRERLRYFEKYLIIKTREDGSISLRRSSRKVKKNTKSFGYTFYLSSMEMSLEEMNDKIRHKTKIKQSLQDVTRSDMEEKPNGFSDEYEMYDYLYSLVDNGKGKLFCSFLVQIVKQEIANKTFDLTDRFTWFAVPAITELSHVHFVISPSGEKIVFCSDENAEILASFGLERKDLEAYVSTYKRKANGRYISFF